MPHSDQRPRSGQAIAVVPGRSKTKTESAHDRFLRLLRKADLSTPDALAKWLNRLWSETTGLDDEWDSYRTLLLKSSLIQCVRDDPDNPVNKDYFIVLMQQHSWLNAERQRLQAALKTAQADLNTAKDALEAEILQGATMTDYAECWVAHSHGDHAGLEKAVAEVERKRAEWKAKCLIESKRKRKARLAAYAKILRERSPGCFEPANWFAEMPIYCNRGALLGYCQATGQDRKKVAAFLKAKGQKPVKSLDRTGAGRSLPLYGFETNMLVLDKWLGDWLLNSHDENWQYHDSDVPGKTFWVQPPERVCETIYTTLWHTAHEKHDAEQAKRFRAILRKHWNEHIDDVKDKETLALIPRVEPLLRPDATAWNNFATQRKVEAQQIEERVRTEYRPLACPLPYAEVKAAFERYDM